MAYTLTRNDDSDLSRTDVKALLNNLAHELADARGVELPTKNVFKTPDIRFKVEDMAPEHYNYNEFTVPVLPTVGAEFEPIDLLPDEVVRKGLSDGNGVYVKTLSEAEYDGKYEVNVIVRDAQNDNEAVDFETYKSWFSEE